MSTGDGEICLVFNGEIYNFRELQTVLRKRGHRFQTQSDSEVILNGYREFGVNCLQHLRGEFAFSIWDNRSRVLFSARDRMGVKPFFYSVSRMAVCSEIKAILSHPEVERKLNQRSIIHYLSYYSSIAPNTFFEGIYKLPAAHYLLLNNRGDLSTRRYWYPEDPNSKVPSIEEAHERIYDLFIEATRDRMISDVPFGVFLSGGVDSGANLAAMTKLLGSPVRSFTIGYSGGGVHNELIGAKESAVRFGADHKELVIGKEQFWQACMESPRFADEPNGNPESIPLFHLSRFARRAGVKVVQVGEGSDELFGYPGWPRFLAVHNLFSRARFVDPLISRLVFGPLSWVADATGRYHYSGLFDYCSERRRQFQLSTAFPRRIRESLYGEAFSGRSPEELLDEDLEEIEMTSERLDRPLDSYQRMLWFELNHRLPESILARVDRMTMSAGLEARVPFLDHRLVDYTFWLPERMRFCSGAKSLFKEAVRDRLLPGAILDRKKRGFSTPVGRWISEDYLSDTERIILDSGLVETRVFNKQYLVRLFHKARSNSTATATVGRHLFQILLLCRWYHIHFDAPAEAGVI